MKLSPISEMATSYSEQPIIQALAQLMPGVGPLDTLLKARAQEIAEERAQVFFEELEKGQVEITPELIQSEDFVHRFVITAKAAANTRRREKIRLFARMLKSSVVSNYGVDTDVYEEYLSILDDLSYREFMILSTLNKHEGKIVAQVGEDDLTYSNRYWKSFIEEVSELFEMQEDEINGALARLNRTGCYRTITGTYWDYFGNHGRLTPIYTILKRLVD